MADNIVHLVLARAPGAPPGTKGISLFIVPKFLLDADGGAGERNSVSCVSIEHKLGIHGSPTCVMSFEDAVGYLVGEVNDGMRAMFTMMNDARLSTSGSRVWASPSAPTSRQSPFAAPGTRAGRSATPPTARRRSSTTPTCAAC